MIVDALRIIKLVKIWVVIQLHRPKPSKTWWRWALPNNKLCTHSRLAKTTYLWLVRCCWQVRRHKWYPMLKTRKALEVEFLRLAAGQHLRTIFKLQFWPAKPLQIKKLVCAWTLAWARSKLSVGQVRWRMPTYKQPSLNPWTISQPTIETMSQLLASISELETRISRLAFVTSVTRATSTPFYRCTTRFPASLRRSSSSKWNSFPTKRQRISSKLLPTPLKMGSLRPPARIIVIMSCAKNWLNQAWNSFTSYKFSSRLWRSDRKSTWTQVACSSLSSMTRVIKSQLGRRKTLASTTLYYWQGSKTLLHGRRKNLQKKRRKSRQRKTSQCRP